MDLPAAVEASPELPQDADELVTGVDGHDEAVAGVPAGPDQHRLDIRLDRGQHAVAGDDTLPRSEGEQALGRSGRAGIERGDPAEIGVVEEERHGDGDLQRLPLAGRDGEVGDGDDPLRNGLVAPASRALLREQ